MTENTMTLEQIAHELAHMAQWGGVSMDVHAMSIRCSQLADELHIAVRTVNVSEPDIDRAMAAYWNCLADVSDNKRDAMRAALEADRAGRGVVVPDKKHKPTSKYGGDLVFESGYVSGWNACREVMIAQGNGGVPDGFVQIPKDKLSLIRTALHRSAPIPEVARTFPNSPKEHREIYAFVEELERLTIEPQPGAEGGV